MRALDQLHGAFTSTPCCCGWGRSSASLDIGVLCMDPSIFLTTAAYSLLTLDIGFQVLNVLLLSGMVGPQQWQEPMAAFQRLAELQGFGLSSKRIAFPGLLNPHAKDCVIVIASAKKVCISFDAITTVRMFNNVNRIPTHFDRNSPCQDCVVSFFGKYSQQWDEAVSTAKTQMGFSLACVFLTDRASGLGKHCSNPDAPGQCWCRATLCLQIST